LFASAASRWFPQPQLLQNALPSIIFRIGHFSQVANLADAKVGVVGPPASAKANERALGYSKNSRWINRNV